MLHTTLVLEGEDCGVLRLTGTAVPAERGLPRAVNRIGLCLLHPLSAAGAGVEVTHDDGRLTRSSLPRGVSPWPPITGIRSLRVALAPGWWAVADFEGESFEIEDQRNNAEASFKTYARSNFLPRPFPLEPGALVQQRVRLAVERRGPVARPRPSSGACDTRVGTCRGCADDVVQLGPVQAGLWRDFALGVALEASDLAHSSAIASARAQALQPGLLHLEWDPLNRMTPGQAAVLAALVRGAGASLRLDLRFLDDPARRAALPALAAGLARAGVVPAAVAAFPTSRPSVDAVRAAFAGAAVGGGTQDFFVQLNRMQGLPPLDFLAFTVCPTVHQADDRTVLSSAQALPGMLATLQHRYPGVPVHVGPSRIAARRSPLGALAVSARGGPMPLAGQDVRDGAAFGVVWAAAQVAGLAAAGAAGATVLRWGDCGEGSPGEAFWSAWSAQGRRGRIQVLQGRHPELSGWRWALAESEGLGGEDWLVHTGASWGVHQRPPHMRDRAVQTLARAHSTPSNGAGANAAPERPSEPDCGAALLLPPRSLTRVQWD